MTDEHRLTLRRTPLLQAGGQPVEDDYCVMIDGVDIGRIHLSWYGSVRRWGWHIQTFPSAPANTGVEDTFEAAKASFRARLDVMSSTTAGRDQIDGHIDRHRRARP